MTAPTAAVTTRGLTKRYGSHTALHGIDLDIRRGSVFGMIGPNGAGKTTTMRLLLDIIRPSGGELRVLGESPRAGGAGLRRRVGYLPGELHLQARVRARELLSHYAEISGDVRPGTVESLADRLGLDLGRPVRNLSKGNKQKVGLIQAFMHEPELLVLDEPTSGLDPLSCRLVDDLIVETRDRFGVTSVVISHDMAGALRIADHIYLLSKGKIEASGTPAELVEGTNQLAQEFFESSGIDAHRLIRQGSA